MRSSTYTVLHFAPRKRKTRSALATKTQDAQANGSQRRGVQPSHLGSQRAAELLALRMEEDAQFVSRLGASDRSGVDDPPLDVVSLPREGVQFELQRHRRIDGYGLTAHQPHSAFRKVDRARHQDCVLNHDSDRKFALNPPVYPSTLATKQQLRHPEAEVLGRRATIHDANDSERPQLPEMARKRDPQSQSKHDQAVQKRAEQLERQGFQVEADLKGPGTIRGVRPDIDARKGQQRVIVEVETAEWSACRSPVVLQRSAQHRASSRPDTSATA